MMKEVPEALEDSESLPSTACMKLHINKYDRKGGGIEIELRPF